MVDKSLITKRLNALAVYEVCWNKGTEPPLLGKYLNCKDNGIYKCVCCRNNLFTYYTKFDSGTTWTSLDYHK